MNLNNISSVSHKANVMKNVKTIVAPLKDGNNLRFTFGDNYLQALVTKDQKIKNGYGKYSGKGISFPEVVAMAKKLQANVADGCDFMREFLDTVVGKH